MATPNRPTARKPVTKRAAAPDITPPKPEKKPLDITYDSPYFEFGCRKIRLSKTVSTTYLEVSESDSYSDGSFGETELEEDFEVLMLTLYKLAETSGVDVPPVPQHQKGYKKS